MGTTAYDNPVVLVKKGVIFAETIASCQLIRQVVRQYRFSIDNTTSSNTLASLTHEEERLRLSPTDTVMQILFDVLDRRHVGKLSIADLDEFLQSLLGRKCTSEAFRLIVLSFGKSSVLVEHFVFSISHYVSLFSPSFFSLTVLFYSLSSPTLSYCICY